MLAKSEPRPQRPYRRRSWTVFILKASILGVVVALVARAVDVEMSLGFVAVLFSFSFMDYLLFPPPSTLKVQMAKEILEKIHRDNLLFGANPYLRRAVDLLKAALD